MAKISTFAHFFAPNKFPLPPLPRKNFDAGAATVDMNKIVGELLAQVDVLIFRAT